MNPLISIVMPVYQVEDYIANSIYSVISQTYSPYELILVNDGTKDGSIKIAVTILDKAHANYTLINQVNQGQASARNVGIRNSSGEWVICVDPDDIIAPDFLKKLYNASFKFKTNVAFSNYRLVNDKEISISQFSVFEDLVLSQKKVLYSFLKRRIRIIAPGMLIKKDFLVSKNLWYDEEMKFSEDQHLIWRVLFSADRIVYVKVQLYYYLIREKSVQTSSDIKKVMSGYEGMRRLYAEISYKGPLKKFFLPRWIFSAINASTRMMDFRNYSALAHKLDYKKNISKLFLFPDLRISIMSLILRTDLKLFFRIGKSLKK